MSGHAKRERAAEWVYRGLWKVLSDWFCVPQEPPTLPTRGGRGGEATRSFHPAPGFLKLLKFQFWFFLFLIDIAILVGWIAITIASPLAGTILAIPAFLIAVVPDIFAYVAIHLRYDTTWYVLSGRSMRVRRGIWNIVEQTITFENVQDVRVTRGPFQQLFGIANVIVATAGTASTDQHGVSTGNSAILEGVNNPEELRDMIMVRVRASRSAGLGDEEERRGHALTTPGRAMGFGGFSPAHVALLREIRDELQALGTGR